MSDESPPARPSDRMVALLLLVGFAALLLWALPVLAYDLHDGRGIALLAACAVVGLAGFLFVNRRSAPWRTGQGPAVLIAAAVWAFVTLGISVGGALGLIVLGFPLAVFQVILVVGGAVHSRRGRPDRALAFGQVAGLGSLLGFGCGTCIAVLLLMFD